MAIFYFDLCRGDAIEEDRDGRHLLDLADAHDAAAALARELSRRAGEGIEYVIVIRNELREELARVPTRRLTTTGEDMGHPDTTTGSGKFQQPVLRGDNRMHIDPATGLPTSPEDHPGNGGVSGTAAQTADLRDA